MRLEGSEPVLGSFRKANHKVDLEFAQGSSVMHGKDVKLVPEKGAIYDISWDNDGMDTPEPCSCKSASWSLWLEQQIQDI